MQTQLDASGITGGERVAVRLSSLVRVASSPDLYVLWVEFRELRHDSLSTRAQANGRRCYQWS